MTTRTHDEAQLRAARGGGRITTTLVSGACVVTGGGSGGGGRGVGRGLTKTGDDYSRHDPRRRSQHARRPASTRSSRSRPTSRARGEGRAHAPRSGEPLELGAELAGEVVVRVVVVPVLLPLVDVLGVFFLRAPLCARGDERMRSGSGPVAARSGARREISGRGGRSGRDLAGVGGGVKGVGTRRRAPSLPNSSNSSSHSRSTATFFLGSSFCSVIAFLGARRASGARRPPARDLVLVVGCQTQGTPRKVLRNSSQTEPLEKRSSPILLGRRRRWRTLAPAPSRTRRDARRGGGAAGTAVRSARNPRGTPPAGAAPVDGRSPRRVPRRARVIRSLGAFPGWRARPSVCRAR